MPRRHREQEAGASYHVTANAVDNGILFRGKNDFDHFLAELAVVVETYRWRCLAVALLDTHYHLLIGLTEANLDRGMQRLNGVYAGSFNRRHARRGHLFRGRFHSEPVRDEPHLLMTVRYIARNRTKAGLAPDPSSDPLSSYSGLVGGSSCWPFVDKQALLRHFGSDEQALARLRGFVEDD
jgi:putative transposase